MILYTASKWIWNCGAVDNSVLTQMEYYVFWLMPTAGRIVL